MGFGTLAYTTKDRLSVCNVKKQATKEGVKVASLALRQVRQKIGPILSSGWDFFEALCYDGTIIERCMRSVETLFGAYIGYFLSEQKFIQLLFYVDI
jgi:hypothetical protein